MSVQDETFDRPVCDYCNKEIQYGEKYLHYNAQCLEKQCSIEDIISKSEQICEMYDQN